MAREWHPGKNGDLTPEKIAPGSGKKVWWLCKRGHEWQEIVYRRNRAKSCPYCIGRRVSAGYNLQVVNPGLANEWHPVKNGNLTPDRITPGSNKKVWWVCKKGHEWQATTTARNLYGTGCPYCSGRRPTADYNLAVVNPGLAKEWHPTKNGKLRPGDIRPSSGKKAWWVCEEEHEWEAVIADRNYGRGCPVCYFKNIATQIH